MSRVFIEVPLSGQSLRNNAAPIVLILCVGEEDAGAFEAVESTYERPVGVDRLAKRLKRITPFNAAIDQNELQLFWTPTTYVDVDDVSPTWVMSQLQHATVHGETLLTDGTCLPYALGRPVLVVVMHSHPDFDDIRGDSDAVGMVPYYVGISIPKAQILVQKPKTDTLWVARALGKVLGLGEESTDALRLSGPDFWGRSFPNLWFDQQGTPSEPPPWPEPYASNPVEGGFGSDAWASAAGTVWRAESSCLMGVGEEFCAICREHLTRVLIGSDQQLAFDPPLVVTPDVLGSVTAETLGGPVQLWSSIQPRRTVSGQAVEPGEDPVASEDGRVVSIQYEEDELTLKTSVVEHRTTLGRTVTLEFELSAPETPRHEDLLSPSGPPDPPLNVDTADLEEAFGIDPDAPDESIRAPARWHVSDPLWSGPSDTTERMAISATGLDDFHGGLRAAAEGLMEREDAERLVLDWADWWWVDPNEGPTGDEAIHGLRIPDLSPDPQATIRETGVAFAGFGIGDTQMWPRALQGEGSPALSLFLASRVPIYELAEAGQVLGQWAYVQCTGVSDMWRHGATTSAGWRYWPEEDTSAGTRFGQAVGVGCRENLAMRWSETGIPQHLDRLHRLVAMDAGMPLSYPPPAELEDPETLRNRLRTQLLYDPDATADALALQAALWWIGTLPVGIADYYGVVADFYGRVLRILVRWSQKDDLGTLLAAYPGPSSFQADLVAIVPTHPGHKAFLARVRALLDDEIGITLALSHRVDTINPDLEAIKRAARSLGEPQLDILTTDVLSVLQLTETVTSGLFSDDAVAELELAQDISNMAAFVGATEAPSAIADGGAELWWRAAQRYLPKAPDSPVPAFRVLAQTPHERRVAFLQNVVPPNAVASAFYAAAFDPTLLQMEKSDDELLASMIVTMLDPQQAHVTDDVWPDALEVFRAAGAKVEGRQSVVQNVDEMLAEADNLGLAPADLAALQDELTQQRDAAVAMRDATLQILHGEAVLDALDLDSYGSDHAARRAQAKSLLGRSALEDHVQRLAKITSYGPLFNAFGAVPPEHMDTVRTHEVFTQHLIDEGLPAHFDATLQALSALNDDGPPDPLDQVAVAAHRAWELNEQFTDGSNLFLPTGLDRAIATLVHAAAALGANRGDLANNQVYTDAIGDLTALTLNHLILAHDLQDIHDGAQDLGVIARGLSVRNFGLFETIWMPETYAEHLALTIPQRASMTIDGVEADGHTQMRFALALSENPGLLPMTPELETLLADHAAIVDLLNTSVTVMAIDREEAEAVRDVLYQVPRANIDATDPLVKAHEELETHAAAARVRQVAAARGGIGYVVVDTFSNAGPEFDEALTRFQIHLQRRSSGVLTGTPQQIYARTQFLAAEARSRGNSYVDARREVADLGVMAASAVAGVAIAVLTGGAGTPLAASLMYSAVGAGAAATLTRGLVEGPGYVSANEVGQDFAQGAAEGLIDAAAGGLIQGVAFGVAGSRALSGTTSNVIARGLLATDRTSRPLVQVGRPMLLGMLEGMTGGATAAVLQTAMDQATWDQSWYRIYWRFIESAALGAGFGGAMGIVGGSLGALAEFGSAAERASLYGWLTDVNQIDLLVDFDAVDLVHLAAARQHLNEGKISDAITELGLVANGPADLVSRLIDPVLERGEKPLKDALDEFNAIQAQLHPLGADPFDGSIEFCMVDSSVLRQEARGGAEVRITQVGSPPSVVVLVDRAADAGVLRQELLHALDIRYYQDRESLWTLLTDSALANWSGMSQDDQLLARQAYLELEGINQRQLLEAYENTDRSTLDSDALFEIAAAEKHLEDDMIELAAIEKALSDGILTSAIDISEAPFLTARRRKPPRLWADVLEATGNSRDDVDQVHESFRRLTDRLGTDVTDTTRIKSGWRRKVQVNGIDNDLVQLGGMVRLTRGDVDASLAGDLSAFATYADVRGWSTFRTTMETTLKGAVANAAPTLGQTEIDAIVEAMMDTMEASPVGFVYGTTPLRVLDYSARYKANAAEAGPFRSDSTVEDLHHLTPLYLLATGQLDLQDVPGVAGKVALKLVDLDPVSHRAVHEAMNDLQIFPSGSPNGVQMSPNAMKDLFLGQMKPAASLIDPDGGMSYYTWNSATSAFEDEVFP